MMAIIKSEIISNTKWKGMIFMVKRALIMGSPIREICRALSRIETLELTVTLKERDTVLSKEQLLK